MRRREFITAVGASVAWPILVRAQSPARIRRVTTIALDDSSLQWFEART
jgi:hypothetical protein